jgi:hypothetical protein
MVKSTTGGEGCVKVNAILEEPINIFDAYEFRL